LEDQRSVGASSCNSGDGTDQRGQSLMFMMMMMIYIYIYCFSLFCDFGFTSTMKMSKRIKDTLMGDSEKKKKNHLSLSVAQKID